MDKSIRITVLFFGATADIAGTRSAEIELPTNARAKDIFQKLIAKHSRLGKHRLHMSVNHRYADGSEALNDGDELAVFTAVSGG